MKNCCNHNKKDKECKRKDGKKFNLPRRFTRKRCLNGNIKGFTMRSSCAPYKKCKSKTKTKKRKNQKGGAIFWRDIKPDKKYYGKYKKSCFLLPKENKYPICDKKTKKMNCKGLLAAHNRAKLSIRRGLKNKTYSYKDITKKARKLAKTKKCSWLK